MIPKQVDTHMKDTLREAIGILFPLAQGDDIIDRHNWRTRKVLGEVDGNTVFWRGWSANLRKLSSVHKTLYIDFVPNILPESERYTMFGEDFAKSTVSFKSFVVAFVTSLDKHQLPIIIKTGFVPREIGPNMHACKIVETNVFLSQSPYLWAGYLAKLANFQVFVSSQKDGTSDIPQVADSTMQADADWEYENHLLDL